MPLTDPVPHDTFRLAPQPELLRAVRMCGEPFDGGNPAARLFRFLCEKDVGHGGRHGIPRWNVTEATTPEGRVLRLTVKAAFPNGGKAIVHLQAGATAAEAAAEVRAYLDRGASTVVVDRGEVRPLDTECETCGAETADWPDQQCPKAERACGHHCNHADDGACHWCGWTVPLTVDGDPEKESRNRG